MTDKSERIDTTSKKSVDMFIEVANASLDLLYALVAATSKARTRYMDRRAKAAASASELRLTTLLHGPRPRLRDTDSVP